MNAPCLTFKAKPFTVYNPDGSVAWRAIKVPAPSRSHCDMAAFRQSRRFGSYANSDLFLSLLKREFYARRIGPCIKLGEEPEGVTVDASGFLAIVTITFEEARQ